MPKKYTLYSASTPGEKKVCAFYFSDKGCRNGDTCSFSHTKQDPSTPESCPEPSRAPPAISTSSTVSSETDGNSSDDSHGQVVQQEKKRKRSGSGSGDIFAKPKTSKTTERGTPSSYSKTTDSHKKSKRIKKDRSSTSSSSSAPTTPSFRNLNLPTASFSVMPTEQDKKESKEVSGSSFRNLNLPIASFSVMPKEQDKKESKEVSSSTPKREESSKFVVPKSSELGRKWKEMVKKCQAHDKFEKHFDFSRCKERETGDVWITAKPYGTWCQDFPQAIAMDCEMCETQDPLTGQKNPSALCRVSIINAENPDDVLLDTLVKPNWPVTNYRTFVNGITEERLQSVQFTLRHAQAFLMALCSQETVIMGHSVHNDLKALQMDHTCCVDSAYLFQAQDSPTATVSLKDMTKTILQKDMPNVHDSVNDARMAFLCLQTYFDQKGQVALVERTTHLERKEGGGEKKDRLEAYERYGQQLFCHRIPKVCTQEHLSSMFLEHTCIQPESVDELEFAGRDVGKTTVYFKTMQHANLAFDTLEGTSELEKSGRYQKKVYLRNGDYIRVRKMIYEQKTGDRDNKDNTKKH